jgi:bacillithiol system protein YtxJ
MIDWLSFNSSATLDSIMQESDRQAVIIFKHSTRCATSAMVKDRLERQWTDALIQVPTYYLDLIQFRSISNDIANTLNVTHESPQILILFKRNCIYDASHSAISAKSITQTLKELQTLH